MGLSNVSPPSRVSSFILSSTLPNLSPHPFYTPLPPTLRALFLLIMLSVILSFLFLGFVSALAYYLMSSCGQRYDYTIFLSYHKVTASNRQCATGIAIGNYTYVYIYISTHIFIYTYFYMCIYTCACIHIYIYKII